MRRRKKLFGLLALPLVEWLTRGFLIWISNDSYEAAGSIP
jgi:hypothetical protein